jgi:3-deoxy-D-manno-octulosonic-acid transferase
MNILILLYLLIIAPKIFWDRISKGKKHPGFSQRIGLNIPAPTGPVIWIHAVSVGEVKAAQPLFRALRKQEPNAYFLITTTSATGQAEAKRSLPEANAFAYLPLDLTFIVRRWVKKLNPKLFILIESDFWYNLLTALRQNNTRIILASGKMSSRSAARFLRFRTFSQKLFSLFDHLCLQNTDHYQRFAPLVPDPTRLHITGNLKLDLKPQPITPLLLPPKPTLTLSCTHAPEEELLLDALENSPYFLILAPRHPERFEEVAQLLKRRNLAFTRWSRPAPHAQILLVDAMGQLPTCYAHSRLAILGGSYVSHIGGHNVLEPCLYHTPVFFGPHTYGQTEFVARALSSGAGKSVPLTELRQAVDTFFTHPTQEQTMKAAAIKLIEGSRGATVRTMQKICD